MLAIFFEAEGDFLVAPDVAFETLWQTCDTHRWLTYWGIDRVATHCFPTAAVNCDGAYAYFDPKYFLIVVGVV